MTTLRLRDVRAGYDGREVVRAVSAEVPRGSWLAIVGPNGAGKSTLLKTMAGLLPGAGEVLLDGRPVHTLSRRDKARKVGYSPQDPILPGGLTVTDYALLGRTPHLGPLAREGAADLSVVEGVLTRLDLTGLAGRRLGTLSGGERQRAVLARVLTQQAGLLLLDEPTTGLDIGHAQAMLELIDRLRREDGTTVVSTLHDLTFAAQYADHVLLLSAGEVVAAGTPAEVLTAEALARYYGAAADILTAGRGELVVAPIRPPK
ncbi:ABC transporter ATP-binding protein [Amycolatopsis acidiphila]|uniref:ABC transporter ATP-binding protein n=1 Tax=Amycolatopsis acidiphila TaxID=715473 RepID=A0A558A9A8_9PSEU|nr:ABC transporter ATP-binding protein [Amycolatopsis acidiphila]TVT20841.1 ABC transporter ATP-binding protein [Amycolatopsis acidiphila]UIJ58387.1 ABC transporter ATP-binding protein [Amycolatopsis acidiphila]GHG93582.1 cobalamin/Fe3+-siderophore ABC transporter ATP-binding protein [Amycolatopsis acidiphila]